jgi:hypothetical protein
MLRTECSRFNSRVTSLAAPRKGQTLAGSGDIDPEGDKYKQTAPCRVGLNDGELQIEDDEARVQVLGEGRRALLLRVGPEISPGTSTQESGKLPLFEATTFFQHPITLFSIPDANTGALVSLGGTSSVGNADAIIWEISGSGVYNDS